MDDTQAPNVARTLDGTNERQMTFKEAIEMDEAQPAPGVLPNSSRPQFCRELVTTGHMLAIAQKELARDTVASGSFAECRLSGAAWCSAPMPDYPPPTIPEEPTPRNNSQEIDDPFNPSLGAPLPLVTAPSTRPPSLTEVEEDALMGPGPSFAIGEGHIINTAENTSKHHERGEE